MAGPPAKGGNPHLLPVPNRNIRSRRQVLRDGRETPLIGRHIFGMQICTSLDGLKVEPIGGKLRSLTNGRSFAPVRRLRSRSMRRSSHRFLHFKWRNSNLLDSEAIPAHCLHLKYRQSNDESFVVSICALKTHWATSINSALQTRLASGPGPGLGLAGKAFPKSSREGRFFPDHNARSVREVVRETNAWPSTRRCYSRSNERRCNEDCIG